MLQASFDKYATGYDADFTFSPIGILQRQLVYSNLMPLLNKSKKLLELNCGTGHDALCLIEHVDSVLATDASPAMIAECQLKSKSAVKGLRFKISRIQDIQFEPRETNFVFSNFGGLNCLSPAEFARFAGGIKEAAGDRPELFFVILGRKCIWEKIYFLFKTDRLSAYRRKSLGPVPTVIGTVGFNTWYYSPDEVAQFFGPEFRINSCGPIGLFVPPSYLGSFFENKRKLLRVFGALDKFFCKFKWAANYGDHFYIHLRKAQ